MEVLVCVDVISGVTLHLFEDGKQKECPFTCIPKREKEGWSLCLRKEVLSQDIFVSTSSFPFPFFGREERGCLFLRSPLRHPYLSFRTGRKEDCCCAILPVLPLQTPFYAFLVREWVFLLSFPLTDTVVVLHAFLSFSLCFLFTPLSFSFFLLPLFVSTQQQSMLLPLFPLETASNDNEIEIDRVSKLASHLESFPRNWLPIEKWEGEIARVADQVKSETCVILSFARLLSVVIL